MKAHSLKRKFITPLVCALALVASGANAFELEFDDMNTSGFFDTTVTASAAMTLKTAPDSARTPSGRNMVFDGSGEIYAAPLSFITDFGMRQGDWGFFTRFGYLYDFEIMDGDNKCTNCGGNFADDRTPGGSLNGIPDGARNEYNAFTLYDAFIYGDIEVAGHPTSLRIGRQVVNWGESNIIGGGISSMINPSDVSRLTTPGTEVKETLLPQEMVYFNIGLTDNTSLEAYYVWQWRRSQFIPVGTFFSPFDFLGQGFNPDLNVPGVEKRNSDKPKNGGQWGIAVHHILSDFNDADLGFYWIRSHAQQPYLQANFDPAGPAVIPGLFTSYHEVFAEDNDTYAISLNGEVFQTGISYQTEFSMREDFWDTRECANNFGLTGILAAIGAVPAPPFDVSQTPLYPGTGGVDGCESQNNDTYTWLGNLTYAPAGGPFGADSQAYLLDWQFQWTENQSRGDLTDKMQVSESSGGAPTAKGGENSPGVDQLDRLVTDFAWGYAMVAAYTYNDVFWNLNVKPTFVWIHNVEGYEPFNSGALVENQRTFRASVALDYQGVASLDLAVTHWPGKIGTWTDRDNVSLTFKYSF